MKKNELHIKFIIFNFLLLLVSFLSSDYLICQYNIYRLTTDSLKDVYPVFSTDGSSLFFHSERSYSERGDFFSIWKMDIDGSNQREIINVVHNSNGQTIWPSVAHTENNDILIFMEVKNLFDVLMIDISKTKVFPVQRFQIDGSEGLFTQLMWVPGLCYASSPVYSPATKLLYWTSSGLFSNNRSQYLIRSAKISAFVGKTTLVSGSNIYTTYANSYINDFGNPLTVSPDGTKIIVSMLEDKSGNPNLKEDLYMFSASNGTFLKRLTIRGEAGFYNRDPNWSPDGTQIVYCSDKAGKSSLWIYDFANNSDYQLTTDTNYIDYSPVWSPDGTKIAFTSVRNNNTDIYLLDFYIKSDTCFHSGVSYKTITIIPDTSAKIGDSNFVLSIYSRLLNDTTLKDISYIAELHWDARYLIPDSIENNQFISNDIINGERIIKFRNKATLNNVQTELVRIHGHALSAPTEKTFITIQSFKWDCPTIKDSIINGSLEVRGICQQNLSQVQYYSNSNINITPSPASDFIEISALEHSKTQQQIFIYNVMGEIVMSFSGSFNENLRIDVSSLAYGLYFVRYDSDVAKFIIFR